MTLRHIIYTAFYHCAWIWMQATVGNPELYIERIYIQMAREISAEIKEYYASGEQAIPLEDVMRELNL